MILLPRFARRLVVGLTITLLGLYIALAGLTIRQRGGPLAYVVAGDLISNLSGARILVTGHPQQLYDRAAQAAAQDAILHTGNLGLLRVLPFVHLPLEPLALAPLLTAQVPYEWIFAAWTLGGLGLLAGSIWQLAQGWPAPAGASRLLALTAISFFPIFATLLLGQSSLLLLFSWAAASVALRRGHDGQAGVALALAAIKPHTILVPVLVLLIMRRWRALGTLAATLGVFTVALMPLLGVDWPLRYLQLVLSVGGYPSDPTLVPSSMENWRGQVVRLLGDSQTANALALGLSALSLLGVAWIWLKPRPGATTWQPASPDWSRRWAFSLLAQQLITPYLLLHDLTLALVPGWILASLAFTAGDRRAVGWLWLGWGTTLLALTASGWPLAPTGLWLVLTCSALAWRLVTSHTRPGAAVAGADTP